MNTEPKTIYFYTLEAGCRVNGPYETYLVEASLYVDTLLKEINKRKLTEKIKWPLVWPADDDLGLSFEVADEDTEIEDFYLKRWSGELG